jgi:hypothetical protein
MTFQEVPRKCAIEDKTHQKKTSVGLWEGSTIPKADCDITKDLTN